MLAVDRACRPHIRQLLLGHGVIVESDIDDAHEDAHTAHPGCRAFDHMEAGLQYCEERFLEVRSQPCLKLVMLCLHVTSVAQHCFKPGKSQDEAEV